ncbi:hypothetical protein [Anatilimnocola aggregata]|uniref:hypothetical protein n=1 Tax=Anatilimnocola aggregata TaxID=2528021 RepID=UPI0011A0A30B|nr:hypothetical protein [Anatilimnocola aggregata]
MGLHAALVAVDLKQPETRDRFIQRVNSDSKKFRSLDGDAAPFIKLAQDIQKDLKAGGKGEIDLDAARENAGKMSSFNRTDFDYLLGRYYEATGNVAKAKDAYINCLCQPTIRHNSRTLAGIGLRRLGGGPADYRDHFLKTP